MSDNYIFVKPGFFRGMGHALDISGALGASAWLISRSPAEADMRALWSDWSTVGTDLRHAMEAVGVLTPADSNG